MRMNYGFFLAASLLLAGTAQASFHLMQVEQVIGAVGGDTSQQALQLRMRNSGQNLVSAARVRAFDSSGSNPIVVMDMATNVGNAGTGVRILIATAAFASAQGITPDFVISNAIPANYFAAGRLTFEQDNGTILWSLSWGGAGYTGSTSGTTTNDTDGEFAPSFAGALPSTGLGALLFQGSGGALSTNNAADYALTAGPATFTNNAGVSVAVVGSGLIFLNGFESPLGRESP